MKAYSQRAMKLREAGYKLTRARLAVIDVLEAHNGHMTSGDVLHAVGLMAPDVGRASVFRALDLLTQLAIIRPTYIDSSMTPTYVMLPGGHHHHIICTECHRVIEFEDCGLGELASQLEAEYNLKINGHLLEFYAVCDACARAQDEDDE